MSRIIWPWAITICGCIAIVVFLSGCKLLQAPQQVVSAVVPLNRPQLPDPLEEQLQLQRYTDDFLSRSEQALDVYASQVGTQKAEVQALRLKLVGGTSLISIVSGPNPGANLLDMVAVTVLTRRTIEDYWVKTPDGAAFQTWLDVCRVLETNVWQIAGRFLQSTQVDELRQGINEWYDRTPDVHNAFFARPHEFASMMRSSKEKTGNLNSVFSLVSLDPTAGLDPAVREVTRTRLFAERAMFAMQRMPFMLRFQIELLSYELAEQPAVQTIVTNTAKISDSLDRLSHAAETISQTAAQLPGQISAERKEILTALDQQETKLHGLATEVNQALVSATSMSTSLNTTIGTFDGLMKLFGVGAPTTNAPPDTNSPPFNILDYAKTADQIGAMAKELNTVISSVDQSVPQVQRLSQTAAADMQKVVDHGFRLGLVLIAVLLVGGLLAGLVFKFVSEKLKERIHPSPRPSAPRREAP